MDNAFKKLEEIDTMLMEKDNKFAIVGLIYK